MHNTLQIDDNGLEIKKMDMEAYDRMASSACRISRNPDKINEMALRYYNTYMKLNEGQKTQFWVEMKSPRNLGSAATCFEKVGFDLSLWKS